MADALVSAIVPVFDGEAFLAEALESALAQTYEPLEILVVDDGSTDRSAEIARSFPVRYLHQENRGAAAARNAGIAASQGELIALLDADDLWTPIKLSLQVSYLERHPDVGFVLAGARAFLEPGVALPRWAPEEWLEFYPWALPTLVARRELFDQIGPYDSAFGVADDFDWVRRALDAGVRWAMLPEVVLRYRIHDRNLSYRREVGENLRILHASIRRRRAARAADAG